MKSIFLVLHSVSTALLKHCRLCADNQHESKDQVTFMGGFKNHGLSTIDFKRSILPLDRHDAPIPFDAPTQVVVAIGDMKVNFGTYKTSLNLETENATIDFSSNGNTCPDRTHNRIDVVILIVFAVVNDYSVL